MKQSYFGHMTRLDFLEKTITHRKFVKIFGFTVNALTGEYCFLAISAKWGINCPRITTLFIHTGKPCIRLMLLAAGMPV